MTATESDARQEAAGGGEGTVHYAVHSPGEADVSAPKARRRAGARESSGESAQSQPGEAPAVDLNKAPEPVTWSDRIGDVAGVFSPPDIWSQDRASLKKIWAHATRGDWTRKTGLPRRLGQIDALFIGVPFVALFYLGAWIAERPSRRWAALILLVLLAQIPPLTWLI